MIQFDDLVEFYTSHRAEIESLLKEWTRRGQSRDARELFVWLCKNLLASAADWTERVEPAVKYLDSSGTLYVGNVADIKAALKKVGYRFNNRAEWLVDARRRLLDDESQSNIVDLVTDLRVRCERDSRETRNLLAKSSTPDHILGLGMKESSHFLRGLGFSHDKLVILDRMVLRQLRRRGVVQKQIIDCIEKRNWAIYRREYLVIEERVRNWANNEVCLGLDALDWVLWSMEKENRGGNGAMGCRGT